VPVFDWLRGNIWSQASRASGEAPNPAHLREHLERRYLGNG
jgi:carboxypeptidase Taq